MRREGWPAPWCARACCARVRAGYAAHCEALASTRPARHEAIRCPTLLVHGADDAVAPLAAAKRIRDAIDGARLETLPGVGHWPMLEAPALAAELLREHLAAAPD